MPVTLTIKKVPDRIVAKLRKRAGANHRSLQGELLALLEESVAREVISIEELQRRVARLKLRTPSESVQMIREDRDAR
jgi:antitoxin FitA